MKRDNIVEALSICDATPGPVARLVKVAILNRERGREGVREALEEAGLMEVPRLEEKLNVLATAGADRAVARTCSAPCWDFCKSSTRCKCRLARAHGRPRWWCVEGAHRHGGGHRGRDSVLRGYNYLVGRVNSIVLDMERAASEIVNIVTEPAKQ